MRILSTVAILVLALACTAAEKTPETASESLFNGRDLSGWTGNSRIWSVQDGAITGQTTAEARLKENEYLIWSGGTVRDFELRLKYRLENGNSGIYCRAKRRAPDAKTADPIIAWQADIDDKHQWTGVIMEWTGRERLANRGEKVTIDSNGKRTVEKFADSTELAKSVKDKDWNDYLITARGGHIILTINGVKMSELQDNDPRRTTEGLLALQVHVGPAMKVQFKEIQLARLD